MMNGRYSADCAVQNPLQYHNKHFAMCFVSVYRLFFSTKRCHREVSDLSHAYFRRLLVCFFEGMIFYISLSINETRNIIKKSILRIGSLIKRLVFIDEYSFIEL